MNYNGLIPASENFDTIAVNILQYEELTNGIIYASGGTLTGLALPVNPTDAANQEFVLSVAGGDISKYRTWKTAVNCATVSPITLSGFQLIDDVNLETGYRILVKDQLDSSENGIYIIDILGNWARSSDCPLGFQASGTLVYTMAGTTNFNKIFVCNQTGSAPDYPPLNFGDNITFIQYSTSGSAAGGLNTEVQFNSNGLLAGSTNFTWNGNLNVNSAIITNDIQSINPSGPVNLFNNQESIINIGSTSNSNSSVNIVGISGSINIDTLGMFNYGDLSIVTTNSGISSVVPGNVVLSAGSAPGTGGSIILSSGSPYGKVLVTGNSTSAINNTTGSLVVSGGIASNSLYSTTILGGTINASTVSSGNLYSLNATLGSAIISNVTLGNLNVSSLSTGQLYAGNATINNLIATNISGAGIRLDDPNINSSFIFNGTTVTMDLGFGSTYTNQSSVELDINTGITLRGPLSYYNSGTPGYANFSSDLNMGSHKLTAGTVNSVAVSTGNLYAVNSSISILNTGNLKSTNISGSTLELTSGNGTFTSIDDNGFYFSTSSVSNYLQVLDIGGTTISGQFTVLGTTGTVLATPTNMLGRPISTGNINSSLITSSSTINSVAISTGNLYAVNSSISNFNATNTTISNLISTNTTLSNLNISSISTGSVYTPVSTITNLVTTILSAGTLIVPNVTHTNIVVTNISSGTLNISTGITAANLLSTNLVTTGLSAGNISVSGSGILTAGLITVSNLLATTTTISNLNISSISTGSVYTPVSTISNLVTTILSAGTLIVPNVTHTNIVATNISSGTLNISTGITTANLLSTSGTVTNLLTTTISSGNIISSGTVNAVAISTGTLYIGTNLSYNRTYGFYTGNGTQSINSSIVEMSATYYNGTAATNGSISAAGGTFTVNKTAIYQIEGTVVTSANSGGEYYIFISINGSNFNNSPGYQLIVPTNLDRNGITTSATQLLTSGTSISIKAFAGAGVSTTNTGTGYFSVVEL